MSSLAEARAVRYLLDAVYDKSLIDAAIKDNIPSQALFHMEQLCEKATKACLAIAGILITREHSYSYYVESILIPENDILLAESLASLALKQYITELPLIRFLNKFLVYPRTIAAHTRY